jgi:hypothetical protein
MKTQRFDLTTAAVFLTLLSARPLDAQNVWHVAPTAGPGVDFTTVASAVAAAQHGDILLLAPGTYATSTWIVGKGLRVRGAGQGVTILQGDLGVVPPDPPNAFKLEGVTVAGNTYFQPAYGAPTSGLTTFADVTFNGVVRPTLFPVLPNAMTGFRFALHRCVVNGVVDCNGELFMSDCTVTAPPGPLNPGTGSPPPGPDAVRIIGTAAIYRSSLTGGTASSSGGPFQPPSQCGRGLLVKNAGSSAVLSGSGSSTVVGASGALSPGLPPFGLSFGSVPAPGIAVENGASATVHPGVVVVGGTNTNTGVATAPYNGNVSFSSTHLPSLTIGPWTTTVDAAVAVFFAPGAAAGGRPYVVGAALGQDVFSLGAGFAGPFLLDGFVAIIGAGTLDASGAASFALSSAPYADVFHYLPIYAQVAVVDANAGLIALGQTTTFQLVP